MAIGPSWFFADFLNRVILAVVTEFLQWLPGPSWFFADFLNRVSGQRASVVFRRPPKSGDSCGGYRNSAVVARAIEAGCHKYSTWATGPPWFFADLLNLVIPSVVEEILQ